MNARSHLAWDEVNQVVKIAPLAAWTEDDVWAYVQEHDIPVNTLHWDDGVPLEEIGDESDLAAWCRRQALPADALQGRLPAFVALRADVRSIVEHLANGQAPVAVDVRAMNQVLERPRGSLTLVGGSSERPSLGFEPRDDDGAGAAFYIALSVAQFLVAGDRRRLKLCANPGCGFAFLDTSTNSSRRWCDMRACGNRQKVRAFRWRGRPHSAG